MMSLSVLSNQNCLTIGLQYRNIKRGRRPLMDYQEYFFTDVIIIRKAN